MRNDVQGPDWWVKQLTKTAWFWGCQPRNADESAEVQEEQLSVKLAIVADSGMIQFLSISECDFQLKLK
jgi:hypothetical protein